MKQKLLFMVGLTFCYSFTFGQTTFSAKNPINTTTGDAPYVIDSGYLDNDAFADIVIGSTLGDTVEYYKNDGDGTFTLQPLVSSSVIGISGILIADLNDDGFNDIIATSFDDNELLWFENDGLGNFSTEQIISSTVDGAGAIVAGDIDDDGTMDIAIVAFNSGDTVWFSNNGAGVFGTAQTIASDPTTDPGSLDIADFDADGDLDIVIANTEFGTVEVYYNDLIPGGVVSFIKDVNTVATGGVYLFNVSFGDVNDDGNLDILVADLFGGTSGTSWYYKELTGEYTETSLTSTIVNPSTAIVADMDDDGFNDVVLSSGSSGAAADIVWFESDDLGGLGTATIIDATQNQAYAFTLNDFDNDGDLDIACVAYGQDDLNWFENLKYTLSVPSLQLDAISIYPNPAKNVINFKGLTNDVSVSITDVLGKNVLTHTLQNGEALNVSNLTSGLYIIKLEGSNHTFKFIKE